MRALAQLGVIHEPDFPEEVGVDVQLMRPGAPGAVDRFGPSMLAALSEFGRTLSSGDMHVLRNADREGRREIMRLMAGRGVEP